MEQAELSGKGISPAHNIIKIEIDEDTGRELKDRYQTLVAKCAKNAQQFNQMSDFELFNKVSAGIAAYSKLLAALAINAKKGAWRVDHDRPGYVYSDNNPSVRIPFHILPYFPVDADLKEYLEIAEKVKTVSKDSAVCLSGSAALCRALSAWSDLDFCEYVYPAACSESLNGIRNLIRSSREGFICLSVKTPVGEWSVPWSDKVDHGLAAFEASLSKAAPSERVGRVDFAVCAFNEAIEATNVIVWMDLEKEGEVAKRSFAFQEAQLNFSGHAPRDFHNPSSIGAYVNFLLDQIDKYIGGDPVKAAKRALSLGLIFQVNEELQNLVKWLQSSKEPVQKAYQARVRLRERLQGCVDPGVRQVLVKLGTGISTFEEQLKDGLMADEDVGQCVIDVKNAVINLLQRSA